MCPRTKRSSTTSSSSVSPLLADADHKIAEAYGVWGEKQTYGRTSIGVKRSSFLVDGEGNLEAVWYNVRPEATVPKALQQVGG